MLNLTNVFLGSKKSLSERLFEYVSAYDIFCYFIEDEVEVGKVMLSPIRNDSRPTFILFIPDDADTVLFKDFAWVGGNIFKFVKLYAAYREGLTLATFLDVIMYIDTRMGIGLFNSTAKKPQIKRELDTKFFASKRVINFKSRDLTDRDLDYWEQYHISEDTLKTYNVKSVHKMLNENSEVTYTVSKRALTFAFVIYNKVKLYRPEESPEFKWRNTCPGHYIQGLEQVMKIKSGNRRLIITKSLKDIMTFYTFLGSSYDIIAPHSETYIFTEKLLAFLYARYDEIFIIFDFDLAGVTGANRLRKMHPDKFKVRFVSTMRIRTNGKIKTVDKDISDYSVDRSREEIRQHLDSMGLIQ